MNAQFSHSLAFGGFENRCNRHRSDKCDEKTPSFVGFTETSGKKKATPPILVTGGSVGFTIFIFLEIRDFFALNLEIVVENRKTTLFSLLFPKHAKPNRPPSDPP